jgi:hypothetical protein
VIVQYLDAISVSKFESVVYKMPSTDKHGTDV